MANNNTTAAAAIVPAPAKTELTLVRQEMLENVEMQLEQMNKKGRIHFPANYSPANALQSAWLILQDTTDKNSKPAFESCTRASIMNALLKTVVSGLSPAKNQVYYIPTGGVLTVFVSYFGTVAMAKRHGMKDDPFAQVVYKGDEFAYEINPVNRTVSITKHEQKIENVKIDNIVAAYAVAEMNDGSFRTEIMTIEQIHKNWQRGTAKGNSPLHKDHPEQACKRTVISRLCKMIVKASDDSDLVMDLFDETDDLEVAAEIDENANQIPIYIDDDPVEDPQEDPGPIPEPEPAAMTEIKGQQKMQAGF